MSDISKCSGEGCLLKKKCWRFLDPPDEWQSWILPPVKNGECDMFWEVGRNMKKIRMGKK
jgi:hypothetical protein